MAVMSYDIRPSKAVMRRILAEVLRRLSSLAAVSTYQYVGFGALEFIDFDMFHRQLGVTDMTSIEANVKEIDRYKWNRPFNGIRVLPGRASDVLPGLDWTGLSIVWLDYVSALTTEVLDDVELMSRVLIPGSVLVVTVNAHPPTLGTRKEALQKAITPEKVPIGVTEATLGEWGLAATQHSVMTATVRGALAARTDGASWRQLLNINYQDRAKMQVLGGVVSAPAVERALDLCQFADIDEVRLAGQDPLHVYVPLLTARERDWLNQRLPVAAGGAEPALAGVKQKDISAYVKMYRWLESAG